MGLNLISKEYTDLAGRTGSFPNGNAWDIRSVKYTVEHNPRLNLSAYIQVLKVGSTFTLTSGTWGEHGMRPGANVRFSLSGGGVITTTVNWVSGADLDLVAVGGYADGTYQAGYFEMFDNLLAFDMFFNQVKNSELDNRFSLIDGETQRLKCRFNNALAPASGLTDDIFQTGNKSGGSVITGTVERMADVSSLARYEIVINYKLWVALTDVDYQASEAIGDYLELFGQPLYNDNTASFELTTSQVGETGYVNENFNGITSDYELDYITWEDLSANVIDAFDYRQDSNFEIRINRISANFNANHRFNCKFVTSPNNAAEYSNLPNPLENNVMLQTNLSYIAYATPTNIPVSSNDEGANVLIKDFEVTDNTDHVIITGRTIPNPAFQTFFDEKDETDRGYKFWVQVDETSLSYDLADTVNVLVDENNAIKEQIPLDSWPDEVELDIVDHDEVSISEFSNAIHLEDDCRGVYRFTLPKVTTPSNPIQNFSMRIIAEKNDGSRFTLEEFIFNTATFGRIQEDKLPLNYSQEREYRLPSGTVNNFVTMAFDPTLDTGSVFGVVVNYGFRARYETWIELIAASDDFYGEKTQNWFPYSDDANWQLKFEVGMSVVDFVEGANEYDAGEFINSYAFDVRDYDDWAVVPGSSIVLRRSDDTIITSPIEGETIKIQAIHDMSTSAFTYGADSWGQIRIRPKDGSPMWIASTVYDRTDTNNPLLPLAGGTKASLTIDGANEVATIECLFDTTKFNLADYTISTRIQSYE